MTIEDIIKRKLGEAHFQLAFFEAQLEATRVALGKATAELEQLKNEDVGKSKQNGADLKESTPGERPRIA